MTGVCGGVSEIGSNVDDEVESVIDCEELVDGVSSTDIASSVVKVWSSPK